MPTCHVCENDYERAFTVTTYQGETYAFDSLECAVHTLAPTCERCGCRVIGHGVEVEGEVFCCSHCARRTSGAELIDSV